MISASCDYGPKGCMDDSACNYDSSVIEEDGSCNYPEGDYSADAYFWSGELYLAQNSLQDARQYFLWS